MSFFVYELLLGLVSLLVYKLVSILVYEFLSLQAFYLYLFAL